ncbi:Protein F37H8.5 [Aphelenchoides avenae]|nr:Protein F37H8.5 [Aphelenchus avenae]
MSIATLLLLLLTTCFLLFGSVVHGSDAIDCSRVPPSLWCQNAKLTEKCGFSDICSRYRKASSGKRVQLTLLYEGLCPGCQNFIINNLYRDVYLQYGDYVDIELVPYGNAKRQNTTITCQHGDEECVINRYESCAIHFMPEPVPFIYCLESQLSRGTELQKAARKCYATFHTQPHIYDQIIHCANGDLGQKLQLAAAQRTENVWPEAHQYVPWLVFNNVSLKAEQFRQNSLSATICDFYVGDHAPEFCTGMGAVRCASSL